MATLPAVITAPRPLGGLLLLLLSGCGSALTEGTADVSGIAGAGAATAVTNSAALATGIGLGIRSIANAGLQYGERVVHRAEQDQIAQAAASLDVGKVADWHVSHDVPIEPSEHGAVTVTRIFGTAEFSCKEIVFSVDGEKHAAPIRDFYTATICRDGTAWHWASAEPATARWGALQ
jgi:hypothetical protein